MNFFNDKQDKVTNEPLISDEQTAVTERDFQEFKDRTHKKLTILIIETFNETQQFLEDHIPREKMTLNLGTAIWRAMMLDFINGIVRIGDQCEKESVASATDRVKTKRIKGPDS
jgi:hypothetical protein